MVNRNYTALLVFSFFIFFSGGLLIPQEYEIIAEIETRRKGNLVTLLFKRFPDKKKYLIVEKKRVIGEIDILRIDRTPVKGSMARGIATYRLHREKYEKLIRSGVEIGLVKKIIKFVRDYSDPPYVEKLKFNRRIVSGVDEREMVLVQSGKFYFGSNYGDRDESPEQVIYLDDFYIDRFEVSNSDYMKFVNSTNSKYPVSWEKGIYRTGEGELPVLVTYYEALAYAKWCGKRLPEEFEWEKAARGSGGADADIKGKRSLKLLYPWGRKFKPQLVNSLEFWSEKKIGRGLKEKYSLPGTRYISVFSFLERGESPYGVISMAGNAMEWTSSWYMPYENSSYDDDRYGRQYKVVRGGAWFSDKHKVRVSNREIGGAPNLYRDNIAGFRCVKEPTSLDRIE